MLRDLFSDPGMVAPSIPVVTRSYEEAHMREPVDSSERPCVMGEECECNMISRHVDAPPFLNSILSFGPDRQTDNII